MKDVNIQLNSSTTRAGQNLAFLAPVVPDIDLRSHAMSGSDLLRAIEDFANCGDSNAHRIHFYKRWPRFLESWNDSGQVILFLAGLGLENPDDVHKFLWTQRAVRDAWRGNKYTINYLLRQNTWNPGHNAIMPDWRRGGFRYHPATNLQAAVYQLLKNSSRARVCANPDCANPFFLTTDPRRKFCSVPCTRPAQKEWRKRWWERHGKQWRKQRADNGRKSMKQTKRRVGR